MPKRSKPSEKRSNAVMHKVVFDSTTLVSAFLRKNGATGALSPMPGSPFAVAKSADYIATF